MTDGERGQLGAVLQALVRAAMADGTSVVADTLTADGALVEVRVRPVSADWGKLPALTAGQLLGLAACLGGGDAASALADHLLERGLDWARAAYEKGKRDGIRYRVMAERVRRAIGPPPGPPSGPAPQVTTPPPEGGR
jgi:hypothetical protein